jgi:DNA-binding NarL/FixJ family response regulator
MQHIHAAGTLTCATPIVARGDGMESIQVLLADDHTMFRQGLAGILASYGGMEVVGEVPNDADALRLAREEHPDVVVMEVQMPFERAKESLKEMRSFPHPPKVVIVTMFENPRYVREMTELGVSAYLVKSSSAEHLIAVVRAAVFDPNSRHVLIEMPREMLEGTQEGSESVLSVRQLEILLLAARGLSARSPSASTWKRRPSSATSTTSTRRWAWAPGERRRGRPSARAGLP